MLQAGPPSARGGESASVADEMQAAPAVTLQFPGLRLTVRTPATAGDVAGDAAAPGTATARRTPGTAPGMFAGGAGGLPAQLRGSASAGLWTARPDLVPTATSEGNPSVCSLCSLHALPVC